MSRFRHDHDEPEEYPFAEYAERTLSRSTDAADVKHPGLLDHGPGAAAFFDVDNTIMQGASLYFIARGLAARDFFTTRDIARFAWKQATFRMHGERQKHIADAQEAALSFIAGKRLRDVVRLAGEIYDERMADRIWPGARALTNLHLDAGQRVWLVTATPVEIAEIIAKRLGLTGAVGTIAATEDGVYTGRLVGGLLHGAAKATAVRELAEREGLDLSRCTAYSDSINDLPMLQVVGRPVAVNPDNPLSEYARDNGWPIYDFRTTRRALRVALPAAAVTGAAVGALYTGAVIRRRRQQSVAERTLAELERLHR
ncbi:MAG: HAD-IB family hydrolase [Streptosporangiales bacterium]|nr:HAD-IB family hydrolase [Streptosporangiales bacterium]MBO0889712.1 HAD-IB family hydrolase [Acidothermales bacterium]